MASAATSLAMVLVVLAALSYGLPATRSGIDFIARTCKKTTNPALCVAMLSADPKSGHASTEHDLASVALQIATNTAKKNAAIICDLGGKYQGKPEGPAWDVCVKAHVIAAAELMIDARPSFNGGHYADALKIVSEAKGAGSTCENAFKGIHKKSPMADMDRETMERCGVAGDLIGLLVAK
ncbi:pectinesterase inhibitor [Aegilops tauschii subsp. strangulata]|uniref:Pectinesterase inhibitor n=1 Tax=Aegilops tauschii TaxID=37682 RepID=R7W4X0_AEGTA|nr:pectinesterase inhibitor [Aegilops tauschii subsp. strangulata]XP_040257810.1 pectinesterase inhibitor-like [Aegilops tauschii subsp. strangulata]